MNNVKLYGLVFLILTLWNCGLLKKTTRDSEERSNYTEMENRLRLIHDTENSDHTQLFTVSNDSAWNVYSIKLWPKGKISYSPELGFEGNFDSVKVTGSQRKYAISGTKLTVEKSDKTHQELDDQQRQRYESKDKTLSVSRVPDLKVVIFGVLIAIILLCYLVKRYFFLS